MAPLPPTTKSHPLAVLIFVLGYCVLILFELDILLDVPLYIVRNGAAPYKGVLMFNAEFYII